MEMAKMEHLDPARFFGRSHGQLEISIVDLHQFPMFHPPLFVKEGLEEISLSANSFEFDNPSSKTI
jgi:hypothetical protein